MKKTTLCLSLIILLLFITLTSYKTKVNTSSLLGIWVLEYKVNNNYKEKKPLILDFQKNNILTIKIYGVKDTTLYKKWFLKSDSILIIDDLDCKIGKLEKNKLKLIDYNKTDTSRYHFKRPKKINLQQNKKQIESILLSNVWKKKNLLNHERIVYYEYFDNKSMIYKNNINDSLNNLQIENWGLTEYKNYYFLYHYTKMTPDGGSWEHINQILTINSNSFSLSSAEYQTYDSIFYTVNNYKKETYQQILGNWRSKNSKDKFYGDYLNHINNLVFFDGELEFNITKEKLVCKMDALKKSYNWILGKDGKTLILTYKDDLGMDIFIRYADIIELSESKLKLHLFGNRFSTGVETPRTYVVNKIQEFKRTE